MLRDSWKLIWATTERGKKGKVDRKKRTQILPRDTHKINMQ